LLKSPDCQKAKPETWRRYDVADLMDLWYWAGLAATTFFAAVLYTVSGFGFALLAAPLYLMFVDPVRAIQLVIIISTALSVVVVPGLRQSIARGLLLRLVLGSLAGLPVGLAAFRLADAVLVRGVVGITILAFALIIAISRRLGRNWAPLLMNPARDLAAGAAAGVATALVGMAGPPVLIYLLLAKAGARTVRATLLAFFALSYGATLASHAVTIGIPGPTWSTAGALIPAALLGGFAGRPIADRLGAEAFGMLAVVLLTVAGLYTAATSAALFLSAQQ
jgi:uncharacterized protein